MLDTLFPVFLALKPFVLFIFVAFIAMYSFMLLVSSLLKGAVHVLAKVWKDGFLQFLGYVVFALLLLPFAAIGWLVIGTTQDVSRDGRDVSWTGFFVTCILIAFVYLSTNATLIMGRKILDALPP